MDVRVGGREFHSGAPSNGGTTYNFDALYWDITPNMRNVFSYEMHLDGQKISVCLTTGQIKPAGDETGLVFTD